VQFCPGEHEAKLATAEGALNCIERIDGDLRLAFGMAGVEMRQAVVVEDIATVIPKKRLIVGTPRWCRSPRSARARPALARKCCPDRHDWTTDSRPCAKRLMGLEPTTFCMASRR
jgi:hypothetical protein